MWNQVLQNPDTPALVTWQGLRITPGLHAVTGDEGSGKTRLLRTLAGDLAGDALWLDLRLPGHDQHTPEDIWAQLQTRCSRWNTELCAQLTEALGLTEHLGKHLFMLSTGSRRKVALVGLLASGVTVTCINQPYVALDMASLRVLRDFLNDMADHPSRAWVVADYEADEAINWSTRVTLQAP